MPPRLARIVDTRALPIALGYLPVAFAFGLAAVALHAPAWFPILLSLLLYAGASQFAALHLVATGAPLVASVLAIWLINLRMALESLSFFRRAGWSRRPRALALWLTDETFVAASLGPAPQPWEFLRLAWLPYSAWVAGTALGALLGGILPSLLRDAFGISIDALFLTLLVSTLRQEPSAVWSALCGAAAALLAQPLGGWSLLVGMGTGAIAHLLIAPKVKETRP
ncbi:MAG: AzlC family ABC transporter permease [Thermaerobacter sp.]|nr:AzlC family ABC transporter permease [Thermaerobacter sp.]